MTSSEEARASTTDISRTICSRRGSMSHHSERAGLTAGLVFTVEASAGAAWRVLKGLGRDAPLTYASAAGTHSAMHPPVREQQRKSL